MKTRLFLGIATILGVMMAAATTISAQTPFRSWTTVGSAGTLNQADQNKVVYSGGVISFPDAPGTGGGGNLLPLQTVQAVIRYNVTAVDGLFFQTGRLCMQTRFRDDGNRARVLLRLIEFNIDTGGTTSRLTFDSNTVAAQANFQTNSASTDWHAFDFSRNAYYVEATLTKQHPIGTPFGGGKPALGLIELKKCIVV